MVGYQQCFVKIDQVLGKVISQFEDVIKFFVECCEMLVNIELKR